MGAAVRLVVSEWKEYKLKDVIDKFIDYRGKTPPKTESGIPLITAKIVKDGRLLEPTEFIADEHYEQWMTRGYPEINDVVLTTEAPLGEVALLRNNKVALAQRVITFRGKKELCDNAFLKYYFQSNVGQASLLSRAQGSTVEGIKSAELRELEVSLPPLPEQKSIASVLSSLDDKIDLLHRQNKTLEALGETLFRQWFVEEAKEGWETGKLGDVIELVYGKGLKEEIRTGRGFPVVGSSGVVGYHSEFLVEGPGIVIGRKGTLGKVVYLFENFFPIDTTYFIKSKVNSVGLFYEYFLLKTFNFEDMNTDSAVPGLNRELALSTEMKIAPFDKLKQYNTYCASLFEKLKQNNSQTRTLTSLRDMLLPKLMSGEVRVSA